MIDFSKLEDITHCPLCQEELLVKTFGNATICNYCQRFAYKSSSHHWADNAFIQILNKEKKINFYLKRTGILVDLMKTSKRIYSQEIKLKNVDEFVKLCESLEESFCLL